VSISYDSSGYFYAGLQLDLPTWIVPDAGSCAFGSEGSISNSSADSPGQSEIEQLWFEGIFSNGSPLCADDQSLFIDGDGAEAVSSSVSSGPGATWEDSNGNGYYDGGDTIVVTGHVYVGAQNAGGSGGGGGGLPPDDSTSIPGPTGDVVSEIPGDEPHTTSCVETTFATPNVSLQNVNRAALAASNAIAQLNDENWEYSSIVFLYNGQVGFTEPYTEQHLDIVDLMGGFARLPDGAVVLAIVHNHPDFDDRPDGFPSTVDWGGYNATVNFHWARGIIIDSNMLLYIYTNADHHTRVYDRTDRHEFRNGCSL
jgi:hypothetical protein